MKQIPSVESVVDSLPSTMPVNEPEQAQVWVKDVIQAFTQRDQAIKGATTDRCRYFILREVELLRKSSDLQEAEYASGKQHGYNRALDDVKEIINKVI